MEAEHEVLLNVLETSTLSIFNSKGNQDVLKENVTASSSDCMPAWL